ncbi:MAG: hypothetical protein R3C28_07880 [Pirellulaceae bacterium]
MIWSRWNADTFAADAESWVDSVGGVAAGVFGQPSLAAGEINGRSVVSLDAADGVDGFRIAVSDSPMSNAADLFVGGCISNRRRDNV